MNVKFLIIILFAIAPLNAMEKNKKNEADRHLLHTGLESIQTFYGEKKFKIKKLSDQKLLFAKFIGSWHREALGELNKPLEDHLKETGINEKWFLEQFKNKKSKDKAINGKKLVELMWNKFNEKNYQSNA